MKKEKAIQLYDNIEKLPEQNLEILFGSGFFTLKTLLDLSLVNKKFRKIVFDEVFAKTKLGNTVILRHPDENLGSFEFRVVNCLRVWIIRMLPLNKKALFCMLLNYNLTLKQMT